MEPTLKSLDLSTIPGQVAWGNLLKWAFQDITNPRFTPGATFEAKEAEGPDPLEGAMPCFYGMWLEIAMGIRAWIGTSSSIRKEKRSHFLN